MGVLVQLLRYSSILVCGLYAYLVARYSSGLLTLRVRPMVSYLALVGTVVGLGLFGLVGWSMPARWLACLLLLVLYYTVVFDTRPLHVLFFCNISLFNLMVLRSVLLAAVSLWTRRSMANLLQEPPLVLSVSALAYLLSCGLLLCCWRRYTKDKLLPLLNTPRTLKLLACSHSLLNIFLLGAATIAYSASYGNWFATYHLSGCLLMLLVFYILLDYCVNISYANTVELRAGLLEDQLEKQLHHYSLMSDYMGNLRKLEHDYRSMVTGLTRLLELEDTAGALAFVQDMQGQLVQATGNYRSYSNHPFVQAILTDAAEQAAGNGIDFRAEVAVPSGFALREIDICRIFSNLLSNAIEACKLLPEDSTRYVVLNGWRQGGWFSLTVENSFDGELLDMGGKLATRKGDPAAHGMGLQNVQEIVEHSGGIFRLEPDPAAGRFAVHLHLPCSSPAALSPADTTLKYR